MKGYSQLKKEREKTGKEKAAAAAAGHGEGIRVAAEAAKRPPSSSSPEASARPYLEPKAKLGPQFSGWPHTLGHQPRCRKSGAAAQQLAFNKADTESGHQPHKGSLALPEALTFHCGPTPGLDTSKENSLCLCSPGRLISKAYFHPGPHLTLTAATRERQRGPWHSCRAHGKPRPRYVQVQAGPGRKAGPQAASAQPPLCLLWPHNRSQFTASCSHTAKEAFQDPGGVMVPTLVQPGTCSGWGRRGGGAEPIHPPVPAFHSCSLRNSVCACAYVHVCMCVCVCLSVCQKERGHISKNRSPQKQTPEVRNVFSLLFQGVCFCIAGICKTHLPPRCPLVKLKGTNEAQLQFHSQ